MIFIAEVGQKKKIKRVFFPKFGGNKSAFI